VTTIRIRLDPDSLRDARLAMEMMQRRINHATKGIARKGADHVVGAAKRNFEGTHPRGHPHVGGNKPNIVTGHLRRSIKRGSVVRVGDLAWQVEAGPTAVYGRRIELGYPGVPGGGRGRQHTRAFPYFKPAVAASADEIHRIGVRGWSAAIEGRPLPT
jgi:hypothetical protein